MILGRPIINGGLAEPFSDTELPSPLYVKAPSGVSVILALSLAVAFLEATLSFLAFVLTRVSIRPCVSVAYTVRLSTVCAVIMGAASVLAIEVASQTHSPLVHYP